MNKELFKKQISILLAIYPSWKIRESDPDIMVTWYELLIEHGFDDENFPLTVKAYIAGENIPPTISKLLEYKKKLKLKSKKEFKPNFVYRDL